MLLLPKDDKERKAWREWVAEGWRLGVEQADEIFETDTARLLRDFRGIVLYRTLVAEGVISELFLAEANMGVTGGGDEMRVGDRIVRMALVGFRGDGERAQATSASIKEPSKAFPRLRTL
jgi:defect-in-organelle-trafficking protein DotC